MLFRVTDVSRRKQIVLVRITCEPAMARYRMFATDSGPAFELPEGITNEARDVDCLITPDVNHSVGKVLVGTNTFSGKPEYLIGFVLPDERAAARAIEQVHRFYLADSKGLTKNHASLPLFSLRRSLGKDAEGKPVFESIYCSLMRDVWSASRRSNAGKPSFGPVTEMTIQLPTPGPSNTPARPKTAGSFSAPKTAVIDGATDQTLLTTNVGLFVGEVKAPEGQESPRLMNCVNALLSDLRPEDWDLATLAKINAALVTPTILGAPQSKEIFVARSFLLPGKLNSPLTFAFSTIEGDRGLLQITSFTDNPRGVKIRYKLVQTETNQNPDARR